jgi:hypothetical protein
VDKASDISISNTTERKVYVWFSKDTEYLTNGDASLGLLGAGENGYTDEDGNQLTENELIALLFDEMTTQEVENLQFVMTEKTGDTANDW